MEKRSTKLRLHVFQMGGERRLGDVQPLRRPCERGAFDDFDKVPELAEIHNSI
jgi:hypothetical protein